jgi:uncharacterized membrane protein YdjX (TVP38/TMEM64 family)
LTQETAPRRTKTSRRRLPAAAGLLAVVALCIVVWLTLPEMQKSYLLAAVTSVEGMEAAIADAGVFAPLASMTLMVLHSLVPFPAEMLAVANGIIFGLVLGVFVTWAGAMLGALLAWWLARRFGQELVQKLLGEAKWKKLEGAMDTVGPRALILARLTPVISFNLVNYAAGIAGVPLWTFLWTTGLGILPITIASVLVGSHMVAAPWPFWAALFAVVAGLMLLHWRMSRR